MWMEAVTFLEFDFSFAFHIVEVHRLPDRIFCCLLVKEKHQFLKRNSFILHRITVFSFLYINLWR